MSIIILFNQPDTLKILDIIPEIPSKITINHFLQISKSHYKSPKINYYYYYYYMYTIQIDNWSGLMRDKNSHKL